MDTTSPSAGQSAPARRPRRGRARHVPAGWALLTGGCALAYLLVGGLLVAREDLWGDEAFTAAAVKLPWGDLVSMLTRIDVNMGAYYLLAKAWTSLFGSSDVSLRMLSLCLAAATVIAAATVVRSWFGNRAGVSAAVLLAANPFILIVGLTARPYAMLALLIVVTTHLLGRALATGRGGTWALLGVLEVVALYTNLLAALVIAAHGLITLVCSRRLLGRGVVLCAGIVLVGALPTLLYIQPAGTLSWIGAPTVSGVASTTIVAAGRLMAIGLIPLAAIALVVRPRPASGDLVVIRRGRYVLPLLTLTPGVLMLALLPVQSLFAEFYLIVVVVPATMLVGAYLGSLRLALGGVLVAATALLGVVSIATTVVPQPVYAATDWSGTAEYLEAEVRPGDGLVFPNTYYRVAFEHYAGPAVLQNAVPVLPAVPWLSAPPDYYDKIKRTREYDADDVRAGVAGLSRVWFVDEQDDFLEQFTEALEADGWVVTTDVSPAGIPVRLLERR